MFGGEVKFDVVIGNPPYQLSDGGGSGTSAAPIYQLFVDQAKRLDPNFVVMVVPARWFSGGKGLDEFRARMLEDNRIRVIEDFPDSSDVFPGVQIKGGVCYFLWDRNSPGEVNISTHDKGAVISSTVRPLLEPGMDVFIRYNEAIPILRKVANTEWGKKSDSLALPPHLNFANIVSVRRPFGLESTFVGRGKKSPSDVAIYKVGGIVYASEKAINDAAGLLNKWKVFITFLGSGRDSFPHTILGQPFIGAPGTACTETYLAIGPFRSKKECESAVSYIKTRFFRFLVLQKKPSQNATRKVYELVPTQDLTISWSDELLFQKYKITTDEQKFIASMVRSMDVVDE